MGKFKEHFFLMANFILFFVLSYFLLIDVAINLYNFGYFEYYPVRTTLAFLGRSATVYFFILVYIWPLTKFKLPGRFLRYNAKGTLQFMVATMLWSILYFSAIKLFAWYGDMEKIPSAAVVQLNRISNLEQSTHKQLEDLNAKFDAYQKSGTKFLMERDREIQELLSEQDEMRMLMDRFLEIEIQLKEGKISEDEFQKQRLEIMQEKAKMSR